MKEDKIVEQSIGNLSSCVQDLDRQADHRRGLGWRRGGKLQELLHHLLHRDKLGDHCHSQAGIGKGCGGGLICES